MAAGTTGRRTVRGEGVKGSMRSGNRKELYVFGNTVRELNVERNPEIERQVEGQRDFNQRRRREQEYASSMNKGYVQFLVAMVAVVSLAMGSFMFLTTKISKIQSELAKASERTIALSRDNDDYERRIERAINIDEVRRIAMEELGMVYPSEGQIVNYACEESDYVRQYAQVPQE